MPHRHHKPGARIFVRSTSFGVAAPLCRGVSQHGDLAPWLQPKKLLRKKKNESWTMRRLVAIRGLTSPTLGVGGNLLCKIVQFGSRSAGILPAAIREGYIAAYATACYATVPTAH